MKKRTLAIAVLAAAAFAGCLKNDGSVNTPRAGVLINLLSPNATKTTIVLNNNTIGTNISFGSVPQYYNQVAAGATSVIVTDSGALHSLLNTTFTTDPGNFYSTFIVDSASKMKAIVLRDSVTYPNTTDSVKVRFFNFAPNSQALSIAVKDSGTITGWTQRNFETQGSANVNNVFLPMKAGTYQFQILPPDSSVPLKDTSITLDGKHIYTLYIKGFYADTTGSTALGLGVVKHG